ncbi:1-phosphofructokinase [Pseudomonas sp. P66]|jgi:1-phosphofructokinase|uniref:Phosphofructokinase n=1 Tax=Pseudomonas arcuscaelestis TaxID=2710591 RepID=A0ABS2C367_9PSED|nr:MULTISPECIES: 1-phosphofructokinase [Pseudomonas]MBM3107898.1 1-phosphofructokinase [Pseudomonas arcuscaelestis]MBM5460316.1 1-phosphofructokinase [Pseudomonas arcuscaelestis]
MAKILTLTLNPALDLTVSLETLHSGVVNRSQAQHSHAAGKGLNVAQVLADLGHSVTVGGFLGADNLQPFESLIARRGFADCFVRVPGETRCNIKLVEADGRVTDINGPGPQVDAHACEQLLSKLSHIAPGHDAVVVAGSLPRGLSPQWLQQLLAQLKAMGLKVALDSSGEALREGLKSAPWLVKPNTDELGEVLGSSVHSFAEQHAAAGQLLAQGVEHVVVSQGEHGVNWFQAGGALTAVPPTVKVASTVGAGDSLLAGMVHGLLSATTGEHTLRLATAIAAQAVTQIGFGINDRAQLAQLECDVRVGQPQQEGCR